MAVLTGGQRVAHRGGRCLPRRGVADPAAARPWPASRTSAFLGCRSVAGPPGLALPAGVRNGRWQPG
jgi:hypothetical protein